MAFSKAVAGLYVCGAIQLKTIRIMMANMNMRIDKKALPV